MFDMSTFREIQIDYIIGKVPTLASVCCLTAFVSFCKSSSCFSWITFSFSLSLFWIICACLRSSTNFFVLFCCFSLSLPSLIPRVFNVLSFITSRALSIDNLVCRAIMSFISRSCLAVSCFCCANCAVVHNLHNCVCLSSRCLRTSSRSSRRCLSARRDHWAVWSETARRTIGSLESSALLRENNCKLLIINREKTIFIISNLFI